MSELFAGVSDAVQGEEPDRLVSAISRWRRRHAEALLVLDQFEELFTLNVPEVQARFARLVGRLVDESGLRVVLGLRDDFFMRCGEHPALAPVFHDVTPLLPPSPEGLKRALREPAARQGVRFEDEALVEEMTAAVSAERGALPLLAFAASRLWEERDRERRLLTREAYERIGGMAGALAQHAEATMQRLGTEREPIVRELFRNLVTAEGTRASRGRAELLSVFADGGAAAEEVLDALVASRLLTEYDAPERAVAALRRAGLEHAEDRDRSRIAADALATAGAVADAGRRRGSATRPAPSGRAPLERARSQSGSALDRRVLRRLPRVAEPLPGSAVVARRSVHAGHDRPCESAEAASSDCRGCGRGGDGRRPGRVDDGLEPQRSRAPESRRRELSARRPASCSPWVKPSRSDTPPPPSRTRSRAWSWPIPTKRDASGCACFKRGRPHSGCRRCRTTTSARWLSARTVNCWPSVACGRRTSSPGTVPNRWSWRMTSPRWVGQPSGCSSSVIRTCWWLWPTGAATCERGRCPGVESCGGGD